MPVPKSVRRVLVGAFVLAVGTAAGYTVGRAGRWYGDHIVPRPDGRLATVHLADPVVLTRDGAAVRVSRFVLDLDRKRLTLEQDELAFDDYGDATRTGGPGPLTLRVRLRREGLTRWEVAPYRRFDQRLRLVAAESPANTYRLVVARERDGGEYAERILDLRGPEIVPDELGNRPQPDRLAFHALGHGGGRRAFYGFEVTGSLSQGGEFGIDPNYTYFGPDGSSGPMTLLSWSPDPVTFRPLGPDPAGRGRRAFELEFRQPDARGQPPGRAFVLVLGPTELSQHLLLVKTDGQVRQVLSLRNKDRGIFRGQLRRLSTIPDDERGAYRELGRLTDYRARAIATDGHVYNLHGLTGDLGRLDPLLARFSHLKDLGFTDATLPPAGLPSLERLRRLEAVSFWMSEVSDDGLASVGRVRSLKGLTFYKSKGPTAAALVRLQLSIKVDVQP